MNTGNDAGLWSLVAHRAQATPQAVAFVWEGRDVTYAEFHELCMRTTGWLQTQEVHPGDRLAVWLVNSLEWLALFFASARLGAILVPINTRYRSDEVTHILNKSGARMLFLQPGFRKIDFAEVLAKMDGADVPALEKVAVKGGGSNPAQVLGRPTVDFDVSASDAVRTPDASDPDQCCVVFSTSGTTKGPKLVMHKQRVIVDHIRRCVPAFGLDEPQAILLHALPFCGVFGLAVGLAGLAAGVPIVLLDTFDAQLAAQLMRTHNVTHTFGSDEMILRLEQTAPGDNPFPTLRYFGFGAFGSSFTEEAMRTCRRGIPLFGMYGSSEVMALFSIQSAQLPLNQRLEGGGRPVAGSDAHVRIRELESGALLPAGELGEIEILAPSNFMGYYNDPEATAQAVDGEGYFRTGDIGYLRDDGSFVYKTRKGDAIRLAGFLVNPVEIEEVLKRLEGVFDAQVVAVDIEGTTRVVGFVIPQPGQQCDEARLIEQTREVVAPFKVPARIWFLDEFPVTQSSNGLKTQRNKLRDMAAERLAAA